MHLSTGICTGDAVQQESLDPGSPVIPSPTPAQTWTPSDTILSKREHVYIYIYKAKYSVSAAFTLALTVVCFRNGTVLQMIQMQMKRSKVLKDPR